MRTTAVAVVGAFIVASGFVWHVARAQQMGITRIDLQRHDLSDPIRHRARLGGAVPDPCGGSDAAHGEGFRVSPVADVSSLAPLT